MTNIIFIDDSPNFMESLFKERSNDGKILFMELLENSLKPITILFFGNYENPFNMLKPIGMPELNQFLDNYAENLFANGYEYDKDNPNDCIYKKGGIDVDVNKSAFLLYEDEDDPTQQKILQRWKYEIEPGLKYNEGNYGSDEINNFLEKIYQRISDYNSSIVLIDMMLVINDDDRFGNRRNMDDIPSKPILSMIIYHYLQTKSVKCAVYSTFAEREIFSKKWIPMYNNFFTDHPLVGKDTDFIIDRNDLSAAKIKEILESD
jgi:hypothetical protein